MEIYYVPFQNHFIVYRPLLPLAFLANAAMVRCIQARLAGESVETDAGVESYLDSLGLWNTDPPPPATWRPSEEHRPTTAVLLMTSACNLRCSYCYAFGGEGPLRKMTSGIARRLIDTAYMNAVARKEKQFSLILHGGGEPTANWEVLTDAVHHASDKDLPCEITMATNGVLSEAKRRFIVAHMNGVTLSCDGVKEVHDAQRLTADGRGSFDRVMETIRAFDEAGFPYGVRITLTPSTFSTLAASVAFLCEETSCRAIQVEPTYSGARGGHVDPAPEEAELFIAAFLESLDVAYRAGKPFLYSGATPWEVKSSFCRAAEDALIATPEGDLVTCVEVHDRSHPLSDTFRVGRVVDVPADMPQDRRYTTSLPIYRGDGVHLEPQALSEFAAAEIEDKLGCRECHCYRHCAGDCATRRSVSPGPNRGRCHVNREITKEILAWLIAASGGVWRGAQPALPTSPFIGL